MFGCNHAACSTSPEGWRVIRSQQQDHERLPENPTAKKPSESPVELPLSAPSNHAAAANSVIAPTVLDKPVDSAAGAWGADETSWDDGCAGDNWGATSGDGDWGVGAPGEWNSDGGVLGGIGDGDAATAAIDALLTEQEARSRQHAVGNRRLPDSGLEEGKSGACGGESAAAQKRADNDPIIVPGGGEEDGEEACCYFPPKALNFSPEPWGLEASSSADRGMEKRIQQYREQEEDRALVAALDEALGSSSGPGSKSGSKSSALLMACLAGPRGEGGKGHRKGGAQDTVSRFGDD